MIVAVPEQQTVPAAGIGIPEHQVTLTWYRWRCTACRAGASNRVSHADLALGQGDRHAAEAQCHTVGQLALFPVGGAR